MRYADTCLLVSLFFRDSGTDAALTWLQVAGVEPVMASHWSLTEFSSAAGLRARAGQITPKLHREALAKFRRFAAKRLILIPPKSADFEHAAVLLDHFESGLRAGDALHLVICIRQGATLCTADNTLAEAAVALGIETKKVGC
ncbi:MAG: type II toxin-antitoxin system VapC family toxin [Nitrosospira sp.]|nr:type II toxin-antitoxin system VapC family toxin [Nitrosospira sp.]MDN5881667.1 type II toxin-antitoxin system VapC family toxin [Nitrosospira sp.]MDN5935150.1 type II toxin-antitoxin system VapC family toxin [Nitrosospira sp.]